MSGKMKKTDIFFNESNYKSNIYDLLIYLYIYIINYY